VAPVAPDDAEYVGIGRQLLSWHVPTRISGDTYTIRSWVWPLLVGGASRLMSGDTFRGPMTLGVGLGGVGLVGAVAYAYRRRGGLAALVCALMLAVTAAVWFVAASTRVDVALIAFLMVTLLVAAGPKNGRRAIVAGVLAGLTLLVKESSALLVLLPVAWMGAMPFIKWRQYATRFWCGFALTVGWWFVVVLVTRGDIFPFEGLEQATARNVPRAWAPNAAAWLLVATWVGAWILLAVRARGTVGVRVLLLAMLAFLPPVYIAWSNELAVRQFAPMAILGAIAVGMALADLVRSPMARMPQPEVAVWSLAAVMVLGAVVPIARVRDQPAFSSGVRMDRIIGDWLRANTRDGDVVTSSFRFETMLWVREADHNPIRSLGFAMTAGSIPPVGDQVWLDWIDGAFYSLPRERLDKSTKASRVMILTGPNRKGPAALATWLQQFGPLAGFTPAVQFTPIGTQPWAVAYRVHRPQVAKIPTILTVAGLEHLNDATVQHLGPLVLAGPPEAVAAGAQRIRALGGGEVTQLVAPEH
ncbi:MAG: hypothetical protein ABIP21_09365, partial [Acidimicrobiia bacterium]